MVLIIFNSPKERILIFSTSWSAHLHHLHKLLKVYLTVSIGIDFFHGCFNCFFLAQIFNFWALEKINYFLIIDGATSILVKHFECCFQVLISLVDLRVHCCCDEFRIVDFSRTIGICSCQNIIEM